MKFYKLSAVKQELTRWTGHPFRMSPTCGLRHNSNNNNNNKSNSSVTVLMKHSTGKWIVPINNVAFQQGNYTKQENNAATHPKKSVLNSVYMAIRNFVGQFQVVKDQNIAYNSGTVQNHFTIVMQAPNSKCAHHHSVS